MVIISHEPAETISSRHTSDAGAVGDIAVITFSAQSAEIL